MKRKIWVFNLILAIVVCALLACIHFQKPDAPAINPDTLTPEFEIPAGGESQDADADSTEQSKTNESDENQSDEAADQSNEGPAAEANGGSSGSNSSDDIVTPEF